jgi:hypothetical protein
LLNKNETYGVFLDSGNITPTTISGGNISYMYVQDTGAQIYMKIKFTSSNSFSSMVLSVEGIL